MKGISIKENYQALLHSRAVACHKIPKETDHKLQCLVAQLCPTLCNPRDCSPRGSSVHGGSPGRNTGVGFHVLLQGIFPTQELDPGLPHCKRILYYVSHQGTVGLPPALKHLFSSTKDSAPARSGYPYTKWGIIVSLSRVALEDSVQENSNWVQTDFQISDLAVGQLTHAL